MPGDRVLIEIMTAANMAGVEQADAGMLGLGMTFASATILMGGAALAMKSMIQISEEHTQAEGNLTAAMKARNAEAGKILPESAKVQLEIAKATKAHADAVAHLAALERGTYVPATQLTERQLFNLHLAEERVARTTGQARVDALTRLSLLQDDYNKKVHAAGTHVGNLSAAQQKVIDTAAKLALLQGTVGVQTKLVGINVEEVRKSLEKFLVTNADFISSQNEVITGYATFIREGVAAKDISGLMTTALNIQAAEGGTLTDAINTLQAAEAGRNIGLKKAVGIILEAIPVNATYAEKQAIIARNLKLVSDAYKGSTAAITPLKIAQDHLATSWEKLSEKDGPALTATLTQIVNFINSSLLPSLDKTATGMNGISGQINALAANPNLANLNNLFGGWDKIVVPGGPLDRFLKWAGQGIHGGSGVQSGLYPYPPDNSGSGTSARPHGAPLTAAQIAAQNEALRRHNRSLR